MRLPPVSMQEGTMAFTRDVETDTVTIASGQTVSSVVDNRSHAMAGIVLPAAFTGVAITFQVATNTTATFQGLYDQYGVAVTMTVAQGRSYTIPVELAPWPWFKLVSGTAEGGDRSIIVVRKS